MVKHPRERSNAHFGSICMKGHSIALLTFVMYCAGSVSHLKASDFHWNDRAYFVLCCCIVLLTELHDVQTLHATIACALSGAGILVMGVVMSSSAIKLVISTTLADWEITFEPSAGPTGGAGLALPACSASLMYPTTAEMQRLVSGYRESVDAGQYAATEMPIQRKRGPNSNI